MEVTRALVQRSWEKVLPIQDEVPKIFYPKLFEIDPSTKPLFHENAMEEQGAKLMKMLTMTVKGLDDLDALVPKLKALAKRHAGYKVKPEMFASVGAALIATLEASVGEGFTPEVKEAWETVYGIMCSVMVPALEAELAAQST